MEAATTLTTLSISSTHLNNKFNFSSPHPRSFPSISIHNYRSPRPRTLGNGKKSFTIPMVKASMSSSDSNGNGNGNGDGDGSQYQIAPLELHSPIGQFLSQILTTNPHLLPAAVDQQLQLLHTQRQIPASSSSSTDLVLYRRIAEVKANERRMALQDILYAMVVQRFMDANVSLIPTIPPPSHSHGPLLEDYQKLLCLHSPEANEMIHNHLALILGNPIADSASVSQISKLRVGQVYAASLMYGYFLKRVDERFQLEKTVKLLPNATTLDYEADMTPSSSFPKPPMHPEAEADADISSMPLPGLGGVTPAESSLGIKPSRLRTYVMSLDGETLQRFATIRSKEAVSIIEKHTEALFGRPEIVTTPQGTLDTSKDELISISFGGLKRLVLEAVTFGSFLWDVETYVDSRYHFVIN